jgi:peroxin-3
VLDQEREERLRERLEEPFSPYSLLWGKGKQEPEADMLQEIESIDEETEQKYLTLSWWICHIGWKDVGERVRRGVEEVFDEYDVSSSKKSH